MLLIAALFAIITTVIAAGQWQKITDTKNVLVTTTEMQAGTTPNISQVANLPKVKKDLPEDVIVDLESIQGKALKGIIPKGTVLRGALFQDIEKFGLESRLNEYPGRQAFAFPETLDTTVGWQIKPGSKVNIHIFSEENTSILKEVPVLVTMNSKQGQGAVVLALTETEIKTLMTGFVNKAEFKFTLLPKELK